MTEELIAFKPDQWDDFVAIRQAVLKEGFRPAADVTRKAPRDLQIARLMTVGEDFPKYSPLVTRPAAIFELNRGAQQATVKFYGENLWGPVQLTIGDVTRDIDCRADTATLQSAMQDVLDCRMTAFPGLWEFAFGQSVTKLPAVSCEPVVTNATERFLGGCVVTAEGWRSLTADDSTFSVVQVIDAIPYVQGEVKLGSVAIASRFGSELWMAGQWSCPAFSFRRV